MFKLEYLQAQSSVHLYVLAAATVVLSVLAVCLVQFYNYLTKGRCTSTKRMDGKTVIITGANSGIGKETAKELAKRGARVIMACRNLDSASKVRAEIVKTTNNQNVLLKRLDLSSLESVRDFADDINRTESRLDVLIHNAGVANTFGRKTTAEGLELTMATNQYGPFLLTHLLINLMKKSGPSRIVVVASSLYRLATLNLTNANPVSALPAYLYYVSKYANIVFTLELARRLKGTNVTANCLHPGMIDSGIWRNVPFPMNLPVKLIVKLFFKTPQEGAQTTIHLAVSDDVKNVSGKYFADCREAGLTTAIQDESFGKKYWEICEKLVQLKDSEPHL
ncbi:unnamed protein product [Bemisia tabaci]|uniref:Retinol dehydrogenase 14 n=1 Tax=Bemisia tabaci TaxID=7038 RepID=A0A9P0C9W6_BEMTA|nr:unnamed protein product [Bemisia tabaci]